jgi:NAD(P)H-flavin reductase
VSFTPTRYRVAQTHPETADTVSLVLTPLDQPIADPKPGQFTMLYAFGIGEIPISVSAGDGARLVQTTRTVGAVSKYLCERQPGDVIGVRGPFGTDWGVPEPPGTDLVVMGGGIGLAPLRPVIHHAVAERGRYGRVAVLVGARTPAELLFPDQYATWRAAGVEVYTTVDRADTGWTGHVGVVTTLLTPDMVDPARTTAMVCGPEPMMRFGARALIGVGADPARIRISLERNMRCGDAECGHCQLGPLLVCRDGPVVSYESGDALMTCREL